VIGQLASAAAAAAEEEVGCYAVRIELLI